MKICHISDSHERHAQLVLPEADILIHSGDFSMTGAKAKVIDFIDWMARQPFKHKICIAGNHDLSLQEHHKSRKEILKLFKSNNIIYLKDSSIIIDGIKYYGSPWQPVFYNWGFNLPRGKALADKWALIPDDVNVLITHGPPYGVLDLVVDDISNIGRDLHQGCQDLTNRLMNLTELKAHCFGHLHLNGGQQKILGNVIFSNAAICTDSYSPTNLPQVFDI